MGTYDAQFYNLLKNFNGIRWIVKAQAALVTKYSVIILFMIRQKTFLS